MREFIYNNKHIVLLILAFLILFPLGIYGFRFEQRTPLETKIIASPTSVDEYSLASDPKEDLIDHIQERDSLSPSDQQAKEVIIAQTKSMGSNVVYKSATISIEYVTSADMFQVEILTQNFEQAKQEATTWFVDNGISTAGICNLPVSFYLNFDVKKALGDNAERFNPLPSGC